jgi:hypothetical protein
MLNFKIITDVSGISYSGFFKNYHTPWHDVISLKQSITGVVTVTAKKGDLSFPLEMKEKNNSFPKLKFPFLMGKGETPKWVYENGVLKETTLENCPLYIEMQKYFKSLEQQVLIEKEDMTISNEPIHAVLFIAIVFLIAYLGLRLFGSSEALANTMLLLFTVTISILVILSIYKIIQKLFFNKNKD